MFDTHLPKQERVPPDGLEYGTDEKVFHISFKSRAIR
jgi:hypothetical protein